MNKLIVVGLGFILCAGLSTIASAESKDVTGTLEDGYCFTAAGAHGPGHKQCAISCAKKGIPVALVEKGSEKIYVLLPGQNDTSLPADVISKMEDEVTVSGDVYNKGGVTFLTVKSVK